MIITPEELDEWSALYALEASNDDWAWSPDYSNAAREAFPRLIEEVRGLWENIDGLGDEIVALRREKNALSADLEAARAANSELQAEIVRMSIERDELVTGNRTIMTEKALRHTGLIAHQNDPRSKSASKVDRSTP